MGETFDRRSAWLLVGGVAGVALAVHAFGDWAGPRWFWASAHVHAAVEAIGALGALIVAVLVWLSSRRDAGAPALRLAASLSAMGVLDLFHALAPPGGDAFVFLRALATLSGGVLAATVWLPVRARAALPAWTLPVVVGGLACLVGMTVLAWPAAAPPMRSSGPFDVGAIILNSAGGAFSTAAAAYFVSPRGRETPFAHLLAAFCLLGIAAAASLPAAAGGASSGATR